MQVRLGGGREQVNLWEKRGQSLEGVDLKYLRPAERIIYRGSGKNRDRVRNEIGISRLVVPSGGASGRLHEGKTCQPEV